MYEVELAESSIKLATIEDLLLEIESGKHDRSTSTLTSPTTQKLPQMQLQLNLILDQNLQRARLLGTFLQQQANHIPVYAYRKVDTKSLQNHIKLLESLLDHLEIYQGLRTRIEAKIQSVSYTTKISSTFLRQTVLSSRILCTCLRRTDSSENLNLGYQQNR